MRLLALFCVSLAFASAEELEPFLSTPPVIPAQPFQNYPDRTFGWQTLTWLATEPATDPLRARHARGRAGAGGRPGGVRLPICIRFWTATYQQLRRARGGSRVTRRYALSLFW